MLFFRADRRNEQTLRGAGIEIDCISSKLGGVLPESSEEWIARQREEGADAEDEQVRRLAPSALRQLTLQPPPEQARPLPRSSRIAARERTMSRSCASVRQSSFGNFEPRMTVFWQYTCSPLTRFGL